MHVIVATDGSPQSLAAAHHLKSFADPQKISTISVVAVIRPLASIAFADEISDTEPHRPGEGAGLFRQRYWSLGLRPLRRSTVSAITAPIRPTANSTR